jgi:hypothetical protein
VLWRKFKLDWSYAIGELFIVVVGVLIALAIDQWNSDRLERQEEAIAVASLLDELRLDINFFDSRLEGINAKEEALLRVRRALVNQRVDTPQQFLEDVILGANFGWNQGGANRETYNDLLGAGKLNIIDDSKLRLRIATYYDYVAGSSPRMDERETAYPGLSYQLVPRQRVDLSAEALAVERGLEQGLLDEELRLIVANVMNSPINQHITAEINLGRFINRITLDCRQQAQTLLNELESYHQSLM